jgi:hypothetical protein
MAKPAAKKGTEVAVRTATSVAVPDYLKSYTGPLGTENIDASKDVTIPRLLLGQAMTPAVKEGRVKEGDIFLNITEEVLAEAGKPLSFVPLVVSKEFLLWRDRNDGGGIMARARRAETKDGVRYVWDKPNTEFSHKVGGKVKVTWKTGNCVEEDGLDQWGTEIPGDKESKMAATAHNNIIVALPEHGDLIAAFSLSKSQSKRAKDFNAMLKLSSAPIFARKFTAATEQESNGDATYANVRMKPAGFVENAEAFERYKSMALGFVGKNVTVDHSGADDQGEGEKKPKSGKF